MFSASMIPVEIEHQRREMLRRAEQQRLIREFRQASPRSTQNRLSLNALLSVIRPVETNQRPAQRVPLKSH